MKEIFGKRLLHARKQAGLSQDELVALIGGRVKKTAIAKYERGEMMAEAGVVEALAKALALPVAYFFRPFTVEIGKVDFRARADMGKRRREILEQQIVSHIERYAQLEQLLDDPKPFVNPLAGTIISLPDDIEAAAQRLCREWNPGVEGIANVLALLEDQGIKIMEIDAWDGFSGYSAMAGSRFAVIVLRKGMTTERKRFTALHELAHLLFAFDPVLSRQEIERLCNLFAGFMLMPSATVRRELGQIRTGISAMELGLLKDKYGISAAAIAVRAYQCGIISSFVQVRLLNYARLKPLEEHIGANKRTDCAYRFELLLSRAISENVISKAKAAELAGMNLDDFLNQYDSHDEPFDY